MRQIASASAGAASLSVTRVVRIVAVMGPRCPRRLHEGNELSECKRFEILLAHGALPRPRADLLGGRAPGVVLARGREAAPEPARGEPPHPAPGAGTRRASARARGPGDRKSTRLNSSHMSISYAVFCLKKKK